MKMTIRALLLLLWLPWGCQSQPATELPSIDPARVLNDVKILSADSLQGRKTGTIGSEKAQRHILAAFRSAGLQPLYDDFRQPFQFFSEDDSLTYQGVNLAGLIAGTANPDRYIVLTAHYDHEGMTRGDIFNGADDNASGVAAVLEAARYFTAHPPRHSLIFAALDAEELSLQGAKAFVADPPVPLAQIMLNINLDMISHNDRNELYASGTRHYPSLTPVVKRAADRSPVNVLFGYDGGGPGQDDWTNSSDHAYFHRAGIPFIYFGVEDHEDYHKPTDTYERINHAFYIDVVRFVLDVISECDRHLPELGNAATSR